MPTTPSLLLFRKIVNLGLTAQAINFAQSAFMGHRVSLSMPVDFMNEYFRWTRAAGEVRPTGRFISTPSSAGGPSAMPHFPELLKRAFQTAYSDLDGVAEGLNYSSTALDSTNDMKRDINSLETVNNIYAYDSVTGATTSTSPTSTHYSVNDLVMAFVLNKCFGSSAFDTWDVVYNLEDAFGMLTNVQLANAITNSLVDEEAKAVMALANSPQLPGDDKGRVDEMFRALLSIDPQRFYKNGSQIPGLFETNTDVAGAGNWCLGVGDKIEIPVRLYFRAPVTVLSVVDNVKNPSSATPDEVETVFIKGANTALFEPLTGAPLVGTTAAELAAEAKNGNMMSLRLQLLCSEPAMVSGETRATSEVAGATIAASVATAVSPVFYLGANYQTQSAIAIVYANLGSTVWTATYSPDLPIGVTEELNGAVLTLTFDPATASAVAGRSSIEVTLTAGLNTVVQSINITISAPPA